MWLERAVVYGAASVNATVVASNISAFVPRYFLQR